MEINDNKHYDISCTICMYDFLEAEEVMNTECKHSFHEKCIFQWIEEYVSKKKDLVLPANVARTYEIL